MPDITGKFSKRSDKVPFMLIQNESTTKGFRMQGFTEVSVSLNPKEYTTIMSATRYRIRL